jgi:hypothetical protein
MPGCAKAVSISAIFALTWSAAAIGCAKSEPQAPEVSGEAAGAGGPPASSGAGSHATPAADGGKGGTAGVSSDDATSHLPPTGGAPGSGPGKLLSDVSTQGSGTCAGVSAADVIAAMKKAHPELADIPATRDPNIGGDGSFVFSYVRSDGSFALVVKRGDDDCVAGCIDNEYWYFATNAMCQPQQVGHYNKDFVDSSNCYALDGEALWGVPASTSAAYQCTTADAGSDAICQERHADFTLKLDAVVKNNLSCASDDDCVIASNSTPCFGSCGVFVNRKGAEAVADLITSAGAAACSANGINCPINPVPPCAPRRAGCVSNMCNDKID